MALRPEAEQQIPEEVRSDTDLIRRELQENEDWYQDLVEHSQDLLCIHDLQGRLLSVNPAPARLLGYSVKEVLQIPMRELTPPEFRAEFDDYLKEIARTGEAHGLMAVMTRSGERRIWEYHNTLRTEGVASPIVRGMAHDVTEQRRAEKQLREINEAQLAKVRENERIIAELKLFRTLVDESNDAIEVLDSETLSFLDVNKKACSEFGYSREELLSMSVMDIDPTFTDSSAAKVRKQLRQSGSLVMQTLHRRKDGIIFPVEVSMNRVVMDREYVIAIARDLSERKMAEARLQESQGRYRAVHERSPIGICWVETRTGRLLRVNPKYCEILGRREDELLGHTFQTFTHPGDLPHNLELRRQLLAGETRQYTLQKRFLRPDGSVRWAEVEVAAMWPEGGDPIWHLAIVQDITDRKQNEQRLGEYERVVEGVEEMIVVVDRDYRYVIANHAYLQYRRLHQDQVIGHHISEVAGVKQFENVIKAKVDECLQGKVVEYTMRCGYPDIGERDLLVSYFPIEAQGGVDRIACVLKDITEVKLHDQALRDAKEFSENLIRTANVIVLGLDTEGNIQLFNEAAEQITGYTFPEVRGRNWSILVPRERFPHAWDEFDRLMAETTGRTFENSVITKSGEERLIAWRNSVVKVNERVVATISFGNDITERRRAEEALQRSEENYRMFVSRSSEGIFREELDTPIPVDLPEDGLIQHILNDSYLAECNDALARMYGLTSSRELIGKRLTEMLPPDDPHNIELTRHFIRSGFCVLERESHEVDIHGNPKIFLNSMIGTVEDGMLMRTWGIQRDVTEKVKLEEARLKAEDALKRSEQRFRIALSGSPIKVFNQDRDLRYTWVYNVQEGWTEGDCLGKTDEQIFGPEVGAQMAAIKQPVLETGKGTRKEFSLNARGKTYYYDLTVEPLLDAAGSVTGVNCACVDITHTREITEELRQAKEKLAEEKLYLEQSIDTELGFGEIIGRSGALAEVMRKVAKVAPSDTTVLLLGDTGTGKELAARALHQMSSRKDSSFIKLNCAAIPSGLLESELFGHEKGAFTGAIARKLGRIELADQGTLFLDEIGEIPLSLQPKLLRVLQDHEFERLGGTQTLRVNFRLLAATNRDLLASVDHKEFRSDLYYRLNVFPIRIPPLHDRREDIPLLVEHFVRKYAASMGKSITSIPTKTMEALVQWIWPGNIRELENFIERSVILTPGSVLQAPLGELRAEHGEEKTTTLREEEKQRILHVLRDCNGQLGGPGGAAARLGLKRTTLQSKLSQLGINPKNYRG
jgi:PAS domain S-box-containing protein